MVLFFCNILLDNAHSSLSPLTRNVPPLSTERIIKALEAAEIPTHLFESEPDRSLTQNDGEETRRLERTRRAEEKPGLDAQGMKESFRAAQKPQSPWLPKKARPASFENRRYHTKESVQQALTLSSIRSIYETFLHLWNVDASKCRAGQRYLHFGKEGKFDVNTTTGSWTHFKQGTKGSIFDFVMEAKGINFPESVQWIGERINAPLTVDPEQFRRYQEIRQKESNAEERLLLEEGKKKSQIMFNQSQPIQGTLAERYLREHRHYQGDIPPDIRFTSLPSKYTRRPAVVSFARNKEGVITGYQTILLDPRTGNRLPKQEGRVVKCSQGRVQNAAVRIQEGEGITYIAEGIETALSIKAAGVEGEILSTFGGNLIKAVPVRNPIVVLCADYDIIGAKTHQNRLEDKEVFKKKGYEAHIVWPATSGEIKIDFNDILKTDGAEKVKLILERQLHGSILGTQEKPIDVELKSNEDVLEKARSHEPTPPDRSFPGATATENRPPPPQVSLAQNPLEDEPEADLLAQRAQKIQAYLHQEVTAEKHKWVYGYLRTEMLQQAATNPEQALQQWQGLSGDTRFNPGARSRQEAEKGHGIVEYPQEEVIQTQHKWVNDSLRAETLKQVNDSPEKAWQHGQDISGESEFDPSTGKTTVNSEQKLQSLRGEVKPFVAEDSIREFQAQAPPDPESTRRIGERILSEAQEAKQGDDKLKNQPYQESFSSPDNIVDLHIVEASFVKTHVQALVEEIHDTRKMMALCAEQGEWERFDVHAQRRDQLYHQAQQDPQVLNDIKKQDEALYQDIMEQEVLMQSQGLGLEF